jgi:hypothetical protein
MSSGAPPDQHRADWYPDPTGRFEYRYHNGQAWTGDVSNDGRRFLDPLRGAGPTPPAPRPAPHRTPSRTSGRATASLVLGIGAAATGWVPFVFVLSAAAAVVGLVLGILTVRRSGDDETDGRSRGFARAGIVLSVVGLCVCVVGGWLTVIVYREVDQFVNIGRSRIRQSECAVTDGIATYSGTIENLSDSPRDYRIEVLLQRRATDDDLYRGGVDVLGVRPGQKAPWEVRAAVDEPAVDCEVLSVTGPTPFGQS